MKKIDFPKVYYTHWTGSLYVGPTLPCEARTLPKDIQPNILQRERNAEKADKINLCFSSCVFMSHQVTGFSHLVTVLSQHVLKQDQPITCHRLRNNHWDHSGHMSPQPDDPALKRQYQSEYSFAVILKENRVPGCSVCH